MAGIISNVAEDVRKLREVKAAIEDVKKSLKGIDIRVNIDIKESVEARLKALSEQYTALVMKIAEAEGKIKLSVYNINKASEMIIQAQEKISKVTGTTTQQPSATSTSSNTSAETASIQAQAKAYNDLRNEINDVLGTRDANVKRMVEEMNAIRLINVEIKRITKLQGESGTLSSTQQKRLEQLNNSLLTHKTALSDVRQVLSNNVRMDNAAKTSMNGLSQSLSRMRIAYRELTEEERNSPMGKELLASINQADAKIKELDATIGNHQRNVGNYKSQWNGLSMSIQQVGRELPSLAYGPKVFFSAISNNLPILFDELKRAKNEFNALKAEGKSATPVWKQVATSLFSWNTALTVGITLLTLYGDKLVNWVAGALKAKDATISLGEVQNSINTKYQETSESVAKQVVKLNDLRSKWVDLGGDINKQKRFIQDAKGDFDNLGVSITSVREAENLLINNTNAFIEALKLRAQAQAAGELAAEQYKKYLVAQNKGEQEAQKEMSLGDVIWAGMGTYSSDKMMSNFEKQKQERIQGYKEEANTALDAFNSYYSQKDKLENDANDKLKQAGISTLTPLKQDNQAEKLRKEQEKYNLLLDKQTLEQKRSAEDLQTQTDQARINAMREGNTRTLEQMKFSHEKEMQQLDRQQEDLLRKRIEDRKAEFDAKENEKEAKNPKYVKQTFNGSNVALSQSEKDAFSNQKMYLSIQQAGEIQSQFEREREAWNSYLIEYGNFQQKKEAIANEYNHKIAKAATEGEKASIRKEKENKLKEVHFDELKSSINFANIFGDLDAQSTEAITKMRDKLKEIIETSAKDLKPTDLKFLQDALTNINLKIADRNPFGELKQGIDSYKNATISVIKAQGDLNTVQQGGEVIIGTYIDKTGKICKELLTQEQAEKNLSRAQNDRSFAQAQLTKSINSIGENGKQLVQAGSDITNMLTDLGVQIPESVKGTLDGVGQVMDSMASIDLMKPMSIVTGITGVLAGIGKTIGSIFGGESTKTKVYEDMKEQLSAINEIYEKIIANSKEEITFGGGFASIKAAEDALDTYYKKIQNYRSVAEAGGEAGASVGSHSYAYRSNKGLSGDWGNISGIIGQNISSVQEMYNLTGEQLYLIQTKFPEAWRKIPSEITDSLNAIINCKDEANELADALNAAMTGVDMNGFYNGFIDSLSDMDTSFEDMCDNFEGYLRKSIMAGLISSQYQSRINDLYKKWSDAAVSDKKITEDESKALRGEYKEIVEEMMKDREEMAKSFGWEISSESTSQSSTKGGFETMSQDTGSELNGRFTSLQISGEEIKNQSTLQSQSLNLLTMKSEDILRVNSEIRNIADETRDLIANSYLELVQISENTGAIIKPIQQMQKDMAEVKKNTSKL